MYKRKLGARTKLKTSKKPKSFSDNNGTTYDLRDVQNNDTKNNFETESSYQQTGEVAGESTFFNLPSTSEVNITPSSSFLAPVSTTYGSCLPELDLTSDDDEDLPELTQEGVREQLLREARLINNLVPHKNLGEIFSYLEANLDNKDRMYVVLWNFLQQDDCGQLKIAQKHITTLTQVFPKLPKQLIEQHYQKIAWRGGLLEELVFELRKADRKSEVKEVPPEQNIVRELPERHSAVESCEEEDEEEEEELEERRYKTLLEIFPDADPEFLREKASTLPENEESFRDFIITNLEEKQYPSLKDYEQRQATVAMKKIYIDRFMVQGFLDIFPDPLNYFKERRNICDDEVIYAINYLKNKFRWLRLDLLKNIYHRHECNLTKAFEELQNIQLSHGNGKRNRKNGFRRTMRLVGEYPKINELGLPLLQEITFLDHKDEIDAYLKEKAERKQRAFEEAKENGELLECGCCFDNQILLEDICSCEEGHLFCKECVRRSVEIAIGEGRTTFSCLYCESEFSLKVLQTVLKPNIFSKLIKRKQLNEIEQADIEGLETCPFCDFASIPEETSKIFQCLNPECMKQSCRACRQLSHIPLRCEEVENPDEATMRIYIEDRMAQTLVRFFRFLSWLQNHEIEFVKVRLRMRRRRHETSLRGFGQFSRTDK